MRLYYLLRKISLLVISVLLGSTILVSQNIPDSQTKKIMGASGETMVKKQSYASSEKLKTNKTMNSREWTILETYPIEENASGLAYDGEYLYFGIYGSDGDRIYRVDPATGDYELHVSAPIEDAYGLTYDGTYLWTIVQAESSSDPSSAVQFDFDGNQTDSFVLPDHYMSGIAYDEGDFWSSTYYDPQGHIYKTDDEGNILNDFAAPDEQPWDLTVEGSNVWMADKWGDALYKIDKATGDLLETYGSEHTDPAGITWDGQYLWYLDTGSGSDQDWLYKVDLSGSGSPVINIPIDNHSYGLVNVGDSETWEMTVANEGAVDLIIENIDIDYADVSTSVSFPVTVGPGDETNIPLTYAPADFGQMETTVIVESNDPLNSEAEVQLTGSGVYEGPTVEVSAQSHNYGTVRAGATTRWYLEVINQGDEMLTIEDAILDYESFYIDPAAELPMDVPVLGEQSLGIWFYPMQGVDYSAVLTLVTNDEETPNLTIDLSGQGDASPMEAGEKIWDYNITTGYDNSTKAFTYLPDLNGDDEHELVVASEDNYVRCLNGNSDDEADVLWEREIYSGNLYHQHSIVSTGDLNGDDFKDLAVGTTGGDRSVRALSGKDGTDIWQYNTDQFGDGGWVYQVFAKYDYDEDGVMDILAATGDDAEDNGPKRIFCLSGADGDLIWDKYAGGPAFSVIGVPDFNGDGLPDVVAGASNESESQGKVMGLDGSNGSVEWSFETSGSSVWALEMLSDITGDGINDVIAGDFGGDYYLIDATDGSIEEEGGIGNDLITWFDRIGDVNGDAYEDIAPAHSGANMVVIDGKTGDYVWSGYLADQCSNVMAMEDVNSDMIKDIAVGTLYQDPVMYIIDGSNGDELMAESYGSPIDGIGTLPDVVGDLSWEAVAGGRDGLVTCYSGGMGLITHAPAIVEANKVNHMAAPNPLKTTTTISFVLDSPQEVIIDILDMKGNIIQRLAERKFKQGIQKVQWDPASESQPSSGVYFYRIQAESKVMTGKVILK